MANQERALKPMAAIPPYVAPENFYQRMKISSRNLILKWLFIFKMFNKFCHYMSLVKCICLTRKKKTNVTGTRGGWVQVVEQPINQTLGENVSQNRSCDCN